MLGFISKAAVHADASTFLFIAATVLFVLAAIPTLAKGWMIAIGLACFSAAFWLEVFID
jgi:flagellar biosynthesis component FlhA